jgi:hypothetical protein
MSALDKRLKRLETVVRSASSIATEAARHRTSLRARAKICELVRNRLREMGIDPELAPASRICDGAAAELAAIPDTFQLASADQAILCAERGSKGDRAGQVRDKILTMAERYRDGHRPDFVNASLFDLLAFMVGPDPEK